MVSLIVLGGGKGTRMGGDRPKVLKEVGGKPLIAHVLEKIAPLCGKPIVVIGFKGEEVRSALGDACDYVEQPEQLGTGNAVACACTALPADAETVLVLYGDHPLVTRETAERLITARREAGAALSLATITVPDFAGDNLSFMRFSRVMRDGAGNIARTVEFKDATENERLIREVNPAYYCFDARWLRENIGRLRNENAAGEYYLPDMLRFAIADGLRVTSISIAPSEGMGANTPEELALLEKYLIMPEPVHSATAL